MEAAVAVLTGKWDGSTLPNEVGEYLIASTYNWRLPEIRAMTAHEYERHILLIQIGKKLDAKKSFV